MANAVPLDANQCVESEINQLADALEGHLDKDVLTYFGPLVFGTDDLIRDTVESQSKPRNGLAVMLETSGGYIEPVRRIVEVFRHNYSNVEFKSFVSFVSLWLGC